MIRRTITTSYGTLVLSAPASSFAAHASFGLPDMETHLAYVDGGGATLLLAACLEALGELGLEQSLGAREYVVALRETCDAKRRRT